MVHIDISYEGGLRTRATHGPSGTTLVTDAPTDNHGRGESFSPTDLTATSLGTCMMTIMGIVAERDGIDLAGLTCRVDKHMVTEPERRIGKLVVSFTMPPLLTVKAREKLERAALHCPVHRSLSEQTEIITGFAYPDEAPAG